MTGTNARSAKESAYPDRRSFIRSLGAASVGLAASGLPALASMEKSQAKTPQARLGPGAPLRIGMIGRTGHTYLVFGELDKIPGARIAAYAFEDGGWEYNCDGTKRGGSYDMDSQRKWVENQSWSSSGPKLYETYQEMLEKEELDLAVACLPYARNAYVAAAAAERGLHILCEKPVAVNFADLDMLESAVKKSNVRLSAMFAMRFGSSFYTIKQAVGRGLVGKPCMGRAQKSYKFGQERPWYYRHREIYGSSILWVGIHAIDYIRWTMGLEVRRVSAFHGNLAHRDYPGCQDHGVVSMELEGGASAAVTLDFLRPEQAASHGDDRLRVIGSQGVVERKDIDGKVELIGQDKASRLLEPESPKSLLEDFVGELRGKNTHLIGPEEAVRVTRICIAATQAADEGRVVNV